MNFPKDFLWGAATASYQIEGAALEDGRGECIWTRFSHTAGAILNDDTGDVACDHYHRYEEDVTLMKNLRLNAYRFSTSWPRVMPNGIGATNEQGLDFYDRLVDTLLEAEIRPFLTLYHWDLPQALQDKGGWANRDIVNWFSDYTELMTKRLGDGVKNWITFNEPKVIAFVAHHQGRHAPAMQDMPTALKVGHHLLLSHAAGVPIIRENVADANVGMTMDLHYYESASDKPEDIAAAERLDALYFRWFLDPLIHGHYPDVLAEWLSETAPDIDSAEVQQAAVPIDFIGMNYYMRWLVEHDEHGDTLQTRKYAKVGNEHTTMGWEVYPDGFYRGLMRLTEDYHVPAIYVTENGAAFNDPEPVDDIVHDPRRIAYLETHLDKVSQAIADGAPIKGYFAWSLMDNFEWALGYSQRFGLVHINYETLERTPKQSAYFYRDFIAQQQS